MMPKVVFNADDFGLCRPVNEAILDVMPNPVSSTSIMVPGVDFDHAVSLYKSRKQALNIGLHFTLTTGTADLLAAEYLYGSVSDSCHSLVASDGLFHPFGSELSAQACSTDIVNELSAQYSKLIATGIEPTHLDAHMFVGAIPVVKRAMLEFGVTKQIPVVLQLSEKEYATNLSQVGLPFFDSIRAFRGADELERHLSSLSQGLHYVILHPALPGSETRHILPISWQQRVSDYELCLEGMIDHWVEKYNIEVTTMRDLKDAAQSSVLSR